MRVAGWICAGMAAFFAVLATVYWYVSGYEPAGTALLALTGGMAAIVAGYLLVVTRRTPDAQASAEASHSGSIWPFAVGASAAVLALAIPYGWVPLMVGGVLLAVTGTAFLTQHWHR